MIVDAAERLLAEQDPLLLTFDEVARAAGVSRPLVHAYLGDRRGLLDAVQVRIIERLDRWVQPGLAGATTPSDHLRSLISRILSFVEAESDAWGVLLASGGLDHPALHQLKGRWVEILADGEANRRLGAQAIVAALLLEAGGWATRGTVADDLHRILGRVVRDPYPNPDDRRTGPA